MDFVDEVRTRSGQFAKRVDHLETEEATKSALVIPFIQMLGYEIFDPTEVVPEFTAGGPKKGEKVDYALMKDGKPTILIECKKYGTNLDHLTWQLIGGQRRPHTQAKEPCRIWSSPGSGSAKRRRRPPKCLRNPSRHSGD